MRASNEALLGCPGCAAPSKAGRSRTCTGASSARPPNHKYQLHPESAHVALNPMSDGCKRSFCSVLFNSVLFRLRGVVVVTRGEQVRWVTALLLSSGRGSVRVGARGRGSEGRYLPPSRPVSRGRRDEYRQPFQSTRNPQKESALVDGGRTLSRHQSTLGDISPKIQSASVDIRRRFAEL